MIQESTQQSDASAMSLLPPPPPVGARSSASGDYAASARMVNDILSLGSDRPPVRNTAPPLPPPPPPPVEAHAGVVTAPTGPRPVPEAALPPPPPPGPLTPDFFRSSRPKKRHKRSS
jgi:hypothetical protein